MPVDFGWTDMTNIFISSFPVFKRSVKRRGEGLWVEKLTLDILSRSIISTAPGSLPMSAASTSIRVSQDVDNIGNM